MMQAFEQRPIRFSHSAVSGAAVALLLLSACEFLYDTAPPRPVLPDAVDSVEIHHGEDIFEPVCVPGSVTCEDLQVRFCAADGMGWNLSPCPPGWGCVEDGVCRQAHPRVIVLVDTSGSMLLDTESPGRMEYGGCGSIEAKGSRLAESKRLFRRLFADPLPTEPRMGLFRFPQRVFVDPECETTQVVGIGRLTGDDNRHATPGERGGWFRRSLNEALLAPLPVSAHEDGRAEVLRWLNGEELVRPTNRACVDDSECTGGLCWQRACYRVVEPELRAAGTTPLGRTIFYVGEYLRHSVLIDGRPCARDSDCPSQGYRCGENGRCFDPLGSCRLNHIVILSDGEDNHATGPTDFFHPLNQARRLRYGLGCRGDFDCGEGATCEPPGTCRPPGEPPTGGGRHGAPDPERLAVLLAYTDPEGYQRLYTEGGRAAQIELHVLDVTDFPDNRLLAWLGGGEYISGVLEHPEAVLRAMELLFDSKEGTRECVP